jgi:SpoVK/Ycf46/Vps4 family AAA+-type ATPase
MVDISAYFAQMPVNGRARNTERASVLDIQTDHIIVFPPTIKGYTLYHKRWLNLQVDGITEVVWDKEAFKSLVMETDTKELIQTLVSLRLESQKPDLISGQSNGLAFLLHGGPGTGRITTAESIAEHAEKPLYRICWHHIGTTAEVAEIYYESVLSLGKAWGCVFLFHEADVFLEQRTPKHPARSAFTAILLKLLEAYDGLLILTSKRVDTFDEAFKTRIQLSLHCEDFTADQRMEIWLNYFERLKELEEDRIDFGDLQDHLEELARNEMNGRQIRNAIVAAQQLAKDKGESLNYGCLNDVIGILAEFDRYQSEMSTGKYFPRISWLGMTQG